LEKWNSKKKRRVIRRFLLPGEMAVFIVFASLDTFLSSRLVVLMAKIRFFHKNHR